MKYFSSIKKQANFGLEREGLRADMDGKLSQKMHPQVFGDKLIKKYITTDFSESQIEMISPICSTIDELYSFLKDCFTIVAANMYEEEIFWCNSMPCIIENNIPVAQYNGDKGKAATYYRELLAKKYGGKKQLLSGIHFNFSFDENTLKEMMKNCKYTGNTQEFKDEIYLKISRNYIKNSFLAVCLFGCSNVCHSSYDEETLKNIDKINEDIYCITGGSSIRNSKYGYKNIEPLYPVYDNKYTYCNSINEFVSKNKISEPKEFYSPIRLKSRKSNFEDIYKNGIEYIEIRNIDINPYINVGIDKKDIEFLYLYIIYLLETDEIGSIEQGIHNAEIVALNGIEHLISIDDTLVSAKKRAMQILKDMEEMFDDEYKTIINYQMDKISDDRNSNWKKQLGENFVQNNIELSKKYIKKAKIDIKNISNDRKDLLMS